MSLEYGSTKYLIWKELLEEIQFQELFNENSTLNFLLGLWN